MASRDRHIWEAGEARERVAVARWLDVRGYVYLWHALGWPAAPVWIGLFLSRALVFDDETLEGDIDILVGTMRWTVPADELAALRMKWRLQCLYPEGAEQFVWMEAAEKGRLAWDPETPRLSAIEAKASWYEPEAGKWKRTHVDDGRRVQGNLEMLRGRGVDQIGFLHLAATAPRNTGVNPWFQASDDAFEALKNFPLVVEPEALGGAGYMRAVLGAISDKTEDMAGAGGPPEILAAPRPNDPALVAQSAGWRTRLFERLTAIQPPRFMPPVYVLECPVCRRWVAWPRATASGRPCSRECAMAL